MKKTILSLLLLFVTLIASFGQTAYTSRKGIKFFPAHLDIVVTVDSSNLRYEVFNHWYSRTYSELRQLEITIGSLQSSSQVNDSIYIRLLNDAIKLKDRSLKLNKRVRHKSLCASIDSMRKISFAVDLALKYAKGPHTLYRYEDLTLEENEFRQRVLANLNDKDKEK